MALVFEQKSANIPYLQAGRVSVGITFQISLLAGFLKNPNEICMRQI